MNGNQLIDNAEALRLFFNDDVYLTSDISNLHISVIQGVEKNSTTEIQEKNSILVAVGNSSDTITALPKLEEPTVSYQKSFDFKFLGKNEKSILILVNDNNHPVSTPQGTELLRKLVLSINLKNADFALVNYTGYADAKFEHLHHFFNCKLLISFGVPPLILGLSEQLRHQLHSINGVRMIFTHNLHELDTDLPAKKALWGTLKNL